MVKVSQSDVTDVTIYVSDIANDEGFIFDIGSDKVATDAVVPTIDPEVALFMVDVGPDVNSDVDIGNRDNYPSRTVTYHLRVHYLLLLPLVPSQIY